MVKLKGTWIGQSKEMEQMEQQCSIRRVVFSRGEVEVCFLCFDMSGKQALVNLAQRVVFSIYWATFYFGTNYAVWVMHCQYISNESDH